MKITDDILTANGCEARFGDFLDCTVYGKHINNDSGEFDLELSKLSNMVGRDWYVHVDNKDFQTIGGCSVDTIEHFNDFMDVLGIDYKLH